jgi:hypothetical protein
MQSVVLVPKLQTIRLAIQQSCGAFSSMHVDTLFDTYNPMEDLQARQSIAAHRKKVLLHSNHLHQYMI